MRIRIITTHDGYIVNVLHQDRSIQTPKASQRVISEYTPAKCPLFKAKVKETVNQSHNLVLEGILSRDIPFAEEAL